MEKNQILALSTKVTEEVIRVDFTPAEITGMKDQVSSDMLKKDDVEEEIKNIKADYKAKVDHLKAQLKSTLRNVRLGFEDRRMLVHNVPDEERFVIEFFSQEGEKVGERKMTAAERPSITYPMRKAE